MTAAPELPGFSLRPIRLVPGWVRPMVFLTATLLGAVAIGLAVFDFSRVARAPGWVVPEGGMLRITAGTGGTITRIAVSEGQAVQAGDPIVEISAGVTAQDAQFAGEQLLYAERVEAGRRRLASREAGLSVRRMQLAAELRMLGAELTGIQEQSEIVARRVELRRQALMRARQLLEAGYASQTLVTGREADLLGEEQTAATLASSRVRVEAQLAERRLAQAALDSELEIARDEWRGDEAALLQQRNAYEHGFRQTYTASADATVVALPRSLSESIPAGSVIAILAPEDAKLEVELLLPPSAATKVAEGDSVQLLLEAFPREKSDPLRGTVSYVSQAVLAPTDIHSPGLSVSGPAIVVRVRLNDNRVRYDGRYYTLTPGMLLTGVVELERRSFVDLLRGSLAGLGQ